MSSLPATTLSATARGELRWFFGGLLQIKAGAAETNGEYTLLEIRFPAGAAAPLHVHHTEDEGFYVLEGSASIHVGDEVVELGPGEHAYGPHGVPHRFVIAPRAPGCSGCSRRAGSRTSSKRPACRRRRPPSR